MNKPCVSWPTHGKAKEARDEVALLAAEAEKRIERVIEHIDNAGDVRDLHHAAVAVAIILRRMVEQGAPAP